MKSFLVLLATIFLVGCSRSPNGVYQSFGSEDKFQMTLELRENGDAAFVTRSNLGNPGLDRAVESSMSLASGKWSKQGANVVVNGAAKDGKTVSYRFVTQPNGDLVWEKNGARLLKAK